MHCLREPVSFEGREDKKKHKQTHRSGELGGVAGCARRSAVHQPESEIVLVARPMSPF